MDWTIGVCSVIKEIVPTPINLFLACLMTLCRAMNDELIGTGMSGRNAIIWNLSRWVKEHHEPQSEYAVLEVRFEPGTPQI
jgi:hypothetical protein